MWETFIFSEPATVFGSFRIEAVEGPTFADKPDYPTLRVIDFQVVGERNKSPGYFDVRFMYATVSSFFSCGLPLPKNMAMRKHFC